MGEAFTGRRRGFTLVEVLMALAIAGLVVSSVAFVIHGAVDRKVRQESRLTARFLAEESLERWIASRGGDALSGVWREKKVPGFPAYSRELRWETLPGGNTRRAVVEVTGANGAVELESTFEP
ncbi:MAG: type II secretion system protein [Candidatus Eisenbacteria bacterium]